MYKKIVAAGIIGMVLSVCVVCAVMFTGINESSEYKIEDEEVSTYERSLLSTESSDSDMHIFTVNVLLAPKGYSVTGDYTIEIAKAENVHSAPASRFDRMDIIDYSAHVINGKAKVALQNGDYVVCISPENAPDNFKRYDWHIDEDTTNQDLTLIVTEEIPADEIMIVLKWDEIPKDIDAHLIGEGDHIKPRSRKGNHAHLDVDSRTGNGIECITITDVKGNYSFLVNNWSREVPLGKSHAEVFVFKGDDGIQTVYRVPENIENVWDVFSISDGELTEVGREGKNGKTDNPLPS